MKRFVGLDVHRESVRACIRDTEDKIAAEFDLGCTREELEEFAKKHLSPDDVVALEATFHSWAIVDVIAPFVKKVVVSNPMATKAIAQSKVKTDKIDARVLSQLLRIDFLPEVWMPDQDTRELRNLCARRATLVSDLVRIKNRIHGVLAKALVPKPKGEIFDEKGQRGLVAIDLPEVHKRQLQSDLRLLNETAAELKKHDEILVVGAWDDPRVKLLITMPGVDLTVALAMLAAVGDIERFCDADRLAAYFGLVPSTSQSGSHCYHGPITKRGNGKARWLLIQAAQHVAKHPGPLGVFFRRIAQRKGRNVAVVATARKLAVIAWHMLKRNEPYRYALPKPTQDKLARFRVRATGAKRKTGPVKGKPQPEHRGSGTRYRAVPPLKEIYAAEGLPEATPKDSLKKGERQMLEELGVEPFVESLRIFNRELKNKGLRKTTKSAATAPKSMEPAL